MSENKSTQSKASPSKTPKKSGKAKPEGFHPKEHKVNVVMSDGSKIEIMTSWGKPDATMYLDVDTKNHPAWQEKGKSLINNSNQQVSKFKNKFGDL